MLKIIKPRQHSHFENQPVKTIPTGQQLVILESLGVMPMTDFRPDKSSFTHKSDHENKTSPCIGLAGLRRA